MKYNNAPLIERKIVFWALVAFFVSLFISYKVNAATMTDLIFAIEKVKKKEYKGPLRIRHVDGGMFGMHLYITGK